MGAHGALAPHELGLAAALVFGLLGSSHCVGMCGPLVGLYASRLGPDAVALARRQHLLFNLGRTLAYAHLGVLFGGLGFLLGIRPWMAGAVGLCAGLVVVAAGAQVVGLGGPGAWLDRILWRPSRALAAVGRTYASAARSPGIVALGVMHGLLPCPLLYVMFTSAVALGDPLAGGVLLFAFGAGTVPAMWTLGALGHRLRLPRRAAWHRAFGCVVAAWGMVLVVRGLQGLGAF